MPMSSTAAPARLTMTYATTSVAATVCPPFVRKRGVAMRPLHRWPCVLSCLLLLSAAGVAQEGNTPRPAPARPVIAILGAMTVEVEALGQQLTGKEERTVQGVRFTTG